MARFDLSRLRRPLLVGAGLCVMALLLAWLLGAFHHRVPPGGPAHVQPRTPDSPRHTVAVVRQKDTESAVGTVRAVRETLVASRILGRIKTLTIERAGQPVKQGETLAEIESSDLLAMVEQARASLRVAETRREKARIDLERTQELVERGVAATSRLETDRAVFDATVAEVQQAQQSLAGTESALAFATVKAPITGIVVDKQVNQGDIVQPGQPICTLYDPTRLQLVAVVREELAGRLQIGQQVDVTLDALGKQCAGTVAEIVPAAQAKSRAFEVKVIGPCQPGVVTGMFGRLHVPVGERDELRVPAAAVQSVGQLDFVDVVGKDQTVARRYVRTGRRTGTDVEVLAGLAAGEIVVVGPGRR
jgi:RND family efflux transporter MFP subunit